MDKSDKPIGRRDFIRVVGGTLVVTELAVLGCGDEAPLAPLAPIEPTGALPPQAGALPAAQAAPTTPPFAAAGAAAPAAPSAQAPLPAANSGSAPPPSANTGAAGAGVAPPTASASAGGPASAPPATPATGPNGSPTPTTSKPGVAANGKSQVFIIKATDRVDGITQALTLFGGLGFAAGRDVVLKPNFNSQYAFPATTHDDTIRTVVNALRAANAGTITLGESAGATTGSSAPTATVIDAKGTVSLCKDLGIEFLSYDEDGVEFETFMFDGMTWEGGLAIPKLMRSDRVKILMPCCKTHTLADFTFSMKLAAGLPPRSRRGLISDMHTNLHEKVVDINKGFTPDLILMDAMSCFIDGGPDSGTERMPNLIVAATDRVALDAVGVAILKSAGSTSSPIQGKIFETRQISRAVEIGLGAKSPDDIELVGNDPTTIAMLQSILDVG